jgi:aryl-alcohol dehydrogenase (NADP+)
MNFIHGQAEKTITRLFGTASLRRLGVETIDLYQLHASDMHTPVEETLSFLDEAVRAGKIH